MGLIKEVEWDGLVNKGIKNEKEWGKRRQKEEIKRMRINGVDKEMLWKKENKNNRETENGTRE